MIGKPVLLTFRLLVSFPSLMQDNINDLVVLADVFCGLWHELVHDLAEQADISTCVEANALNQLGHGILVLFLLSQAVVIRVKSHTYGAQILQIDEKHLLLPICYSLLQMVSMTGERRVFRGSLTRTSCCMYLRPSVSAGAVVSSSSMPILAKFVARSLS